MPSERTTKAYLKLLRPFGRIYADMEREIVTKTTRQLKTLVRATEAPDRFNCWWAVYSGAPIVRQIAEGEIARRANLKLKKKKP